MARSYGQIVAAIWRDPDFRKLPINAQWAYIMLATQGDISSCGLLPVTLGRWANYAADLTKDALSDALSTLSDQRFVVVDWDTEELLVRSFAKWDGGSTNSKRRPAIGGAANAIVSPVLREVAARELDKLGVPHGITDRASDTPSDDLSDRASDTPRVVKQQDYYPEPEPEPETGTVALAQEAPDSAQTIVAEWMERTPKRPPSQVVGIVAKHTRTMLAEGIDPDDIRRGIRAWMDKGLHPSTLPSVVNEVMNAPARSPNGKATTKAQGWLDVGKDTQPSIEGRTA